MRIGHRKGIRKLTFRAIETWSERVEELWAVCGLYTVREMKLCYWLVYGYVHNNRINYLNERCSLIL